jgi:hypothetical protein
MRWLSKEEFKVKMECINLLKYNKLNTTEKERRYELATILSDSENEMCCNYHLYKNFLINKYGLKEAI